MEREQKPDLSGRVNGLDISIFRRGQGIEISVDDATGKEVILFRFDPQGISQATEKPTLSPTSLAAPAPSFPPAPEQAPQTQQEAKIPIKVVGIVEAIEGMGETPNTHDPVFRFSIKWHNPKTSLEETRAVAAFRDIGLGLNRFYTSPEPDVKLQPGRSITMMAWDHPESASFYPSSVSYLTFPTLTNPKKRR